MNKKYMKKKELYSTKDVFIASTLYACGLRINDTNWVGKECYFTFDENERAKELERMYYRDEIELNPRVLVDSYKTIKSMIFSNR